MKSNRNDQWRDFNITGPAKRSPQKSEDAARAVEIRRRIEDVQAGLCLDREFNEIWGSNDDDN